jgi:pyruvate dehydrogenase E1 component
MRRLRIPATARIERRLKSLIALERHGHGGRARTSTTTGIGGHISTYCIARHACSKSGSTISSTRSYGDQPGDLVYFQGHASPGVYARAFLEGRLTEEHLQNFRHELRESPRLAVLSRTPG